MNCKQTRSNLMDYQSGNLDSSATFKVEKHLSDCAICKGYASEFQQFQHLLQAKVKLETDPFLTNRIMEMVTPEATPVYKSYRYLTPKLARVAAIAVLVLIGVLGGLELGSKITDGLATGSAGHSEIVSLVNELELEPLERMLLNLNNPGQ